MECKITPGGISEVKFCGVVWVTIDALIKKTADMRWFKQQDKSQVASFVLFSPLPWFSALLPFLLLLLSLFSFPMAISLSKIQDGHVTLFLVSTWSRHEWWYGLCLGLQQLHPNRCSIIALQSYDSSFSSWNIAAPQRFPFPAGAMGKKTKLFADGADVSR